MGFRITTWNGELYYFVVQMSAILVVVMRANKLG